ncbi:lysophospholipid acyltransferase family protein [Aureivirga sp. CE67]|uniref:lysophospholipid acyltransferase family protein n=1 Tax=Aureivirga sp. CE67 TaxID=1788983 RepID=UPI0018CAD118|nr:lysophospholipid acyltransferase family protein [Aureivirga sp. CE67]
MQLIVFIIVYPIIWLISILPFPLLYLFSDFLFFLLYHVIGYRKKVVYNNIKLAFPEKSHEELKKIEKKFYSHFVDVFLEMMKTFTISGEEINKRYKFTNLELLKDLEKKNKSIIVMGSHYANWEWMAHIGRFLDYEGFAAYTKIGNPYFDNIIKKTRGRFKINLVQSTRVKRKVQQNYDNNVLSIYGLLADQSPQIKKANYWGEFLGVKVPIFVGTEVMAKKYDFAVVYINVEKIKRGHYEASFELITEDPNTIDDFKITDKYVNLLEKQIRRKPEFYFWTHKRFKHKDKAPKN